MKIKRKLSFIMFIVLLVSSLAGCTSTNETTNKGGETTSITFWVPFSGPDGPWMKKIVDKYNNDQSQYKVDFQIVPQSEYYKMVDLAFSGEKNAPDVLIIHGDQIPTYVEKNVLKDLTSLATEYGIKEDDYAELAWKGAQIDGKQYGIPLDIHPLLLYWNKDLFKQAGLDPNTPPKNREEFLEMAKKLTDESKNQYGFVVPTLWPQQFIFPTIVYQNGGNFMENGEINYNTEEAVEALTFMKDLVFKHKVSPENVQQDGEVTLFLQGKNAMHLNGPWMLDQWRNAKLNFGVAPVPQLGLKEQAVFGNSHNFVVPNMVTDDNKIAAILDFVKYVGENSIDWAMSGQAPVSKKVYESAELQKMVQQPQIVKEFDYVKFSPRIANWGKISSPLWEEINLVLLGKKDPQKALEDATVKAKQMLD